MGEEVKKPQAEEKKLNAMTLINNLLAGYMPLFLGVIVFQQSGIMRAKLPPFSRAVW